MADADATVLADVGAGKPVATDAQDAPENSGDTTRHPKDEL